MGQAQIKVSIDLIEADINIEVVEQMIRNALTTLGQVQKVAISKIIALKAQVVFPVEVATEIPEADLVTEEGIQATKDYLQLLAIQQLNDCDLTPIISSAQTVDSEGTEFELEIFNK